MEKMMEYTNTSKSVLEKKLTFLKNSKLKNLIIMFHMPYFTTKFLHRNISSSDTTDIYTNTQWILLCRFGFNLGNIGQSDTFTVAIVTVVWYTCVQV